MAESVREHVIVVSGRAERKIRPDHARWTIAVDAESQTELETLDECSRRASERTS